MQEVIDTAPVATIMHTTCGGRVLTFPMQGEDGRLRHSIDPDARDSYRSAKQMMKKSIFLGYDVHIANMTPAATGERHAALAFGIEVAPGGSNKAAAGLRLIDRLNTNGYTVESVCVDRGYSMAKNENWALELIKRKITQQHDLGSNETRLAPGDQPGVIFLDGHPYLAVMPKRLRELRRPGLGASEKQVAQSAHAYNERIPYAFSANGPVRPNGAQRYRGPVLTGKVRCPNHPASMRQAPHKPLTNCVPGEPCACGLTLTVQADDVRTKHRQSELYGTENWLKRYGARNLSESFNASPKNHHMTLKRYSTRVYRLTKNTIMLGFIVAATNLAILRSRYGWDEGRPETLPPLDQPLVLLPQKQSTGSNARHRQPPTSGPPPDPAPGEEPWTDLN